jgi:hypothetical protein
VWANVFPIRSRSGSNLISQRGRIIICVLTGRLVSCMSVDTSSSFSSYSVSGLLAQENSALPEVSGVVPKDCGRPPVGGDRCKAFTILRKRYNFAVTLP